MPKKGGKFFLNRLFFILSLPLLVTLASCQLSKKSTRLIVASSGKITSLDPAQASTFDALQLLSALGDPLYKINKEGTLEGVLAKELPVISENGRIISIPLRDDVFFHDGTPFNSMAMAFSLKRFMKIGRLNYLLDGRIKSIETPSPYELRINLTRPSASFEGLLTSINLTPISPIAYSSYNNKFLNDKFIGTGPYRLASFSRQKIRLEPNKSYWGKSVNNNGIEFIKLSNSTALFGALRTGEIDVLMSNSLDEDQHLALHEMARARKIREGEGSPLEIGYITFNSNLYPLNNKLVRQGLLYSFDRNLIVERVSYGLRKPLYSMVPPLVSLHNEQTWPSYDPIRAKELFREAGYCGEKKLRIPFTFRSNVPADKLLALTWQAQLNRDLSECLEITLEGVESITVYKQLGKGAFTSVMLDWRGAYPHAEAYLTPFLSCKKSNGSFCSEGESAASGSFWTNNQIKRILQLSDRTLGEERNGLLKSAEKGAANGASYLPVWLVTPRAWAQNELEKPEFDTNGHLKLSRLRAIENE